MDLIEYFQLALSRYAEFDGRSRRSEYWFFVLGNAILSAIARGIDSVTGLDVVDGVLGLALLVPSIAVAARRLQDIGKSGWWLLIAFTGIGIFVLLFWFCQNSERFDNEWGPSPKYGSSADVTDHLVDEDF